MATFTEYALANIARVDFITVEDTPVTYSLTDVASNAEVTAYISDGIEDVLRVKNTIKAQNKTQDLVLGYDITLTSATMIPEILALVDGGTWASDKYTGAPIGVALDRVQFKLIIYCEEKDGDGSTKGYVGFTYKNCEGTPLNFSMQDGEFFVPEMGMKSRPKLNESPIEFEILTALPA